MVVFRQLGNAAAQAAPVASGLYQRSGVLKNQVPFLNNVLKGIGSVAAVKNPEMAAFFNPVAQQAAAPKAQGPAGPGH